SDAGNTPPTLSISEPDGTDDTVVEGASYNIIYSLEDPDDEVTATFYYDTDNMGLDGIAIGGSCTSASEGTEVSCAWDTNGMTPGIYYVYGVTEDVSGPISTYSPGQITINDTGNTPPTLSISEPDGTDDTVVEGASYNIIYSLEDPDDEVTATFYYDTDNMGLDGIAIGGSCTSASEGTEVSCAWDTNGMTPGIYYVYGVTEDVSGPISTYSPGQITINGGISSNIAPLATVTASSENISTGQLAVKAVDGVPDGYPVDHTKEWATLNEKSGAWIQLTWSGAYTVDRIILYDRPNTNDQIMSATLSFSDGSELQVGPLDNSGGATEYTFSARVITSVTMTVDQAS
ncbi:MAG: discoidin domain-containing protein, partial [Anaerohalosphaeraceae bacterium]|nr:discoidin domain-containing protein [Anaerohalosphaeraceae bacterium]